MVFSERSGVRRHSSGTTRVAQPRVARGRPEGKTKPSPMAGEGFGGGVVQAAGRASARLFRSIPVIPRPEVANFAFRLFLIPAVAFLQFASEDFRLAFQLVDLVVGQLAPLLFDLAFQLREI